MGKRYAVLDAQGVVVNHILIDDPLPAGYWPGYGAALVPIDEVDASAGAALDVHLLKIQEIPQIGDTLNVDTGELTKFVPEIITQKDDKGEDILVAAAPEVALVVDVDPAEAKQVIDSTDIDVKPKGGK